MLSHLPLPMPSLQVLRKRNLLIDSIFLKHFTYVFWQGLWHLLSDLPSYVRWSNTSIQKIYKFTTTELVLTEILTVFLKILNMKNGYLICWERTYIRANNPTKKTQQKEKSTRENKDTQITEEKRKRMLTTPNFIKKDQFKVDITKEIFVINQITLTEFSKHDYFLTYSGFIKVTIISEFSREITKHDI